jgi:Tc5 transposase DNA-binding domain
MIELWVSKAMAEGILLKDEVLCQKWTKFADLAGVPQDEHLNLSDGWLSCFKACTGLKQFKHHGDVASADLETVKREWKCIQELINKYGYELQDIFNMDETGLFYAYVPHHIS